MVNHLSRALKGPQSSIRGVRKPKPMRQSPTQQAEHHWALYPLQIEGTSQHFTWMARNPTEYLCSQPLFNLKSSEWDCSDHAKPKSGEGIHGIPKRVSNH